MSPTSSPSCWPRAETRRSWSGRGRSEQGKRRKLPCSFCRSFLQRNNLRLHSTRTAFLPRPPRLRHRCESGALHRDTFVSMSFYTLHERTSKEGRTVHRYLAFCAWWLLPRPRLARDTGMCCPGKRSGTSQRPLERRMLCLALARTPSGWTYTAC